MATYTSNYGWTKPSGSDNVDISVLNDNLDDQDSTIHDAFLNMAPPFSESSTYAVDDIVLYGTGLYKCHTAVVTPGSWTGSTNWQVYKLSEGGSGGGGTTNYNALTNKPQINSVELSGNKTATQLGLMASDGVVANPTGQTTGTLTALEVGGTKYAVPSGGGGTSDYTDLTNKPSINGVTLSGNKTTSDLGINADKVMMSDGVTNVEDAVDEKITGSGITTIEHEELTTRDGHGIFLDVNGGFLSSGYLSLTKIGKQIIIHVGGKSSKSNADWICCLHEGYRPWLTESFQYCLGNQQYTGSVDNNGYIRFNTLDTTNVLSATVIFNIA